jgi:hypothetical protein
MSISFVRDPQTGHQTIMRRAEEVGVIYKHATAYEVAIKNHHGSTFDRESQSSRAALKQAKTFALRALSVE